jgi:ribonuclease BN (tRNA processing enzyme)
MKVIVLGSGGFVPTRDRETSAVLADVDDKLILFDAGTGVRHLQNFLPSPTPQPPQTLNVVLSHYHLDHVGGLTWLLRLWKGPLRLFLPSMPLVEANGHEAIQILTSPPYFSLPLNQWPYEIELVEITGDSFDVGSITVSVLKQAHNGGSVGYRVGPFAYITDTLPGEAHIQFLRSCSLTLMDAMRDTRDFDNLDGRSRTDHGHSVANAEIARAADVQRLGFIHLDPSYNHNRVHNLIAEAQAIFSETLRRTTG